MVLFNVVEISRDNGRKILEFIGEPALYKKVVADTHMLTPGERGLFSSPPSEKNISRSTLNKIYERSIPWLSNDFGVQLFHGDQMQLVIDSILSQGGKVYEADDMEAILSREHQ